MKRIFTITNLVVLVLFSSNITLSQTKSPKQLLTIPMITEKPLDVGNIPFVYNSDEKYNLLRNSNIYSSYKDGRIGIGTNAPESILDIVHSRPVLKLRANKGGLHTVSKFELIGAAQVGNIGEINFYNLENSALIPNASISAYNHGAANNADLVFCTSNQGYFTQRVIIKNDSKVGIGSSEPNYSLHINDLHGAKVAFGDNNTFEQAYQTGGLNVLVGEYGTTDSDILHVHGKNGTYFTYGNYKNEIEKIGMVITANGNVGIGLNESFGYKLAVNGTIGCKEINVESSSPWPDYVFSKNYQLRSIKDVEEYINENNHLPEVPSALEIEENGINISEMNTILLKKIEEMTLYIIQIEKELQYQKEEINELKSNK